MGTAEVPTRTALFPVVISLFLLVIVFTLFFSTPLPCLNVLIQPYGERTVLSSHNNGLYKIYILLLPVEIYADYFLRNQYLFLKKKRATTSLLR